MTTALLVKMYELVSVTFMNKKQNWYMAVVMHTD